MFRGAGYEVTQRDTSRKVFGLRRLKGDEFAPQIPESEFLDAPDVGTLLWSVVEIMVEDDAHSAGWAD